MNKYVELYRDFIAIQRTKSENFMNNVMASTIVSTICKDDRVARNELDKYVDGARKRIDDEETRQVRTLLTSVLDAMVSDRVNGSVHRTEVIFANVFEQYQYLFAYDLGYSKIIDEVVNKARDNTRAIEKPLSVPIEFGQPGITDSEPYNMVGISYHGAAIRISAKDNEWNDKSIWIETQDHANLSEAWANDRKNIKHIVIILGVLDAESEIVVHKRDGSGFRFKAKSVRIGDN